MTGPIERNDQGVAIFGSNDAVEGEEIYERARELGSALGRAGIAVVSGGYGGVMEAASRGAREAGGEAIGVTCRLFRTRQPNRFLSLEIEEPDLPARQARLLRLARSCAVFPGGAGTLAELALVWAQIKMGLFAGPIVLFDEQWEKLGVELHASGRLEKRCLARTRAARGLDEACQWLISGTV